MVITNLQEKENRKLWVPIRGGNRGGWSLFNWQDVRQMPYKDREMYLGNSVTVGVLDKGGKWRKRDWYMKTDKKYSADNLLHQQNEAIRKDYERMNAALGMQDNDDEEKLTQQEMRELMKKIKMKKQEYTGPQNPDAIGLGFDKLKVQIRSKPSAKMQNPHKLEAFDELEKQHICSQQKYKREKKQKKQKKQKKKKEKQQKQRQHKKQEDDDRHKKKSKKDKHKKKQKQRQRQHSEKKKHRDRSRQHQKRRRRHSSSSSSNSE